MRRTPTDLALVDGLAVAALLVSFHFSDNPALRAALAGPLVFVLPGYALCMALLPRRAPGRSELLIISVGLSLAVCALGGLALTLTPWGLGAETWAALLCSITLGASIVAVLRREAVNPPIAAEASRAPLSIRPFVLVGVSVVVASASLWVARMPPPELPSQAYSVLWAIPAPDEPGAIRVGVNSGEAETQGFEVRIVAGAQQLAKFPIQLAPAGVWEKQVPLVGVGEPLVEVQLYRADAPDVIYRRVALHAGV